MQEEKKEKNKKKGFVDSILDRFDKKLEKKSREKGCCCCEDDRQ